MTRDEILNMEAGREMDALIAEKVMGLRVIRADWEPHNRGIKFDDFGNYSQDIAAAWEVVEKLRLTITPNHCYPVVKARWCVDTELKGKNDIWLVGAETAPLAICKAALLAVIVMEAKDVALEP